ncbi:DUF4270 family protein [Myroides ceti]|uniref:DUF4270 family protein n=1 Tax=Paenimyroides ceti TaxID=395087 RepID=A0ABT8D052_9FLAO|nr:DUF4270 family protein [Paenimyroides ceti]MDN3709859.1 DUF4270 family protein [Paenimyroides ceti]
MSCQCGIKNGKNRRFNSRNLPYNTFGVFQNGVFGKTTAHFVTQIEMIKGTELSEIGNNPVLDSVYVYIPYTSTVAETDSDGNATYNLTNVYGTGKFSLMYMKTVIF